MPLYSTGIMQSQYFYETRVWKEAEKRMGGGGRKEVCVNCIYDPWSLQWHFNRFQNTTIQVSSEHKTLFHTVVFINCQLWFLPFYVHGTLEPGQFSHVTINCSSNMQNHSNQKNNPYILCPSLQLPFDEVLEGFRTNRQGINLLYKLLIWR